MEAELLRLVGTDNRDGLRIIDNGEGSYLVNDDIIVTEGANSPYRPLHCSELDKKLRSRDWHKFDTKFFATADTDNPKQVRIFSRLYSNIRPNGVIDLINTDPDTEDIENYSDYAIQCNDQCDDKGGLDSLFESVSKELGLEGDLALTADKVDILYKKLFGAMKEKEISFYSIQKEVVDILDGSVVFDLIRYGSAEYTDTVNLGEVLNLPHAPEEYGKIDLSVQYTKLYEDNTFRIHCGDTTFTAFSFNIDEIEDSKRLVVNDIVGEINNEVQFEFLNGTIKVSPLTNDINECIISSCTLTYGRN